MSLTPFQRRVCRLLADVRVARGERYVAGGVALNHALGGTRVSRDIDLFHDTDEALAVSSRADREMLEQAGLEVEPRRAYLGMVEVLVRDGSDVVEVQWVRDSAYRFYPLVMDRDLGLTLHPFDLATNKILALVGRVVVRDWVDTLTCHQKLSPLGCLAWAASGKDPGLSPLFILEEAARTTHYSAAELAALDFAGPRPQHAELTLAWRAALREGHELIERLPAADVGKAVLDRDGVPFVGELAALESALAEGELHFHAGSIGGAVPVVKLPTS